MEEQSSPIVFFEWLKRRRKALDMTQDELAKRAGCSVGALRKIESGDRRPSKQLAGLLAEALQISKEDQQTFIRAARGEFSPERFDAIAPFPDLSNLSKSFHSAEIDTSAVLSSNRIPYQATPLIGRDVELAALERIFHDPGCRLLTLTGVGGIGKTRLAIEFAAHAQPAFPGGVFYIPLTPVNSPEKIVPAIADVLDFGFSGPSDPERQLINYLSHTLKQEALFVLDNLEQLLIQGPPGDETPEVVGLISEILRLLPKVKILGTSRERLNLHGEWAYELHGLSVPPTSVAGDYAGRLEEYDSIALFVNNAQRIRPDFQVTVEDRFSMARICQLVEGVPLAIELAAAWVGILSCQEIAKEIKANMDFLTTSMRDIPERHRSIRATFDHSWNLLSGEERRALSQLSVFQGGFDRTAAYRVAGTTLPILASLSAKSLVRRVESGRYDLHEVIRQYSMAYLKHDPDHFDTYVRHTEYYLEFMQAREESLKRASQQAAFRELADEIDNILAAWAWGLQHKKFAQLGQGVRTFGWYFEIAGLYREGIEQLELLMQALKAESEGGQWHRLLGLALIHQALLAFRTGEFDRARNLYEESILLLRPIGDQALLADALIYSGTILHLEGEYLRARSSLEEGLAYARAANDRWLEAYASDNLGYIASLMGNYTEGYEQMLSSINLWRTLGDPHVIALGLNFLVPTLLNLGRYEEAKASMQESIALCEQAKNRWGMGTAYRYLGLTYLAEGRYAEAKAHLRKSLEVFGLDFVGWDIARSLTYLGDASRLSGDLVAARNEYQDGLRMAMAENTIPIALDALAGLSYLAAQAGDASSALLFCFFILNHPSSEEETKGRVGQLCADLGGQLTSAQVEAARQEAHKKSIDSILNDALK